VILFVHNRYRTTGGEERAVDDLVWLVREHLGEDAELVTRDSAALGRARAAAGLLRGGLDEGDLAAVVRRTGARVVHAHNLLPAFGWRALAAAREAGARVVVHLHNYRLVCAVGTCFTHGADCTRCHGRRTLPGVRLNCRGAPAESAAYGAALALWQKRLAAQADAFVVPSASALARLQQLGAPLGGRAHVLSHFTREVAGAPRFDPSGPALVASRLAPEKGVDVAIDACRSAGIPLVVAGDGPLAAELRSRAAGAQVEFVGRVSHQRLAELRAGASIALVPSRSAETFGLAAAEAMGAGLPVAATRTGALADLVPADQLAPPGDVQALGALATRLRGDEGAAARGLEIVREKAAPEAVAPQLAALYERVTGGC
jgi:glycosyltransferase involved in cell wall biosynthesis